jgi:hypothetical protein
MNRREIKFILSYLDNNRDHLDSLQTDFVDTLKKQYNATGVLTKSQAEFLYEYIISLSPATIFESEPEKYSVPIYSSFDNPVTLGL